MPYNSNAIVGVDFGAPRRARDQRRKIIAIAAYPTDWRRYRIDAIGMNARLLANDPPGWTAKELLNELLTRPVRIAAFDFPFCIPDALLRDEHFAADAGHEDGAFCGWRAFSWFVAQRLALGDPLDFRPFEAWHARANRARLWTKRATDIAAGGQPPLKDKFQATFQMTLLGNALLARLWESHRYRVLPFPGGRGTGEVIEVYPGATLRQMGMANYKSRPNEAIRLGIAACAAAGIKLDIDRRLGALCRRYSSGRKTPDYDAADAFVALCTAILHAEGACHEAIDGDPPLKEREGAVWVPDRHRGVREDAGAPPRSGALSTARARVKLPSK
jgi:hypothetical protein